MARNDELAAVKAASEMIAEDAEDEATTAATQGASDEAVSQEAEEEAPLFPAWEVPEDLAEEIEEEDYSPEATQRELEQTEEYQELDAEGQKLLARARAAEKRAEHYEKLRLQESRKSWVEEAEKHLPYATPFLDSIQADSRRSFIKQAKEMHEKNAQFFKPFAERATAEASKAKEQAIAEGREEAKKNWGNGTGSSDTQPTEAAISAETLARNRSKGDLTSTIKAMIFAAKEE